MLAMDLVVLIVFCRIETPAGVQSSIEFKES